MWRAGTSPSSTSVVPGCAWTNPPVCTCARAAASKSSCAAAATAATATAAGSAGIRPASRPGRSAIFMTGTPMSRSMAEIYTMQRYLQLDMLREYGIERFDAWAATFGEPVTAMGFPL